VLGLITLSSVRFFFTYLLLWNAVVTVVVVAVVVVAVAVVVVAGLLEW